MAVSSATGLIDQPVRVSITGLSAGVTWSASADFRASDAGALSLDQAPTGGAYTGVNPMGLFERMTPGNPGSAAFAQPAAGTYGITLRARVGGRTAATAVATRETPQAAGVTATELRVPADGVYGRVFRPKDNSTRKPALLVFGGSEGGLRPAVVLKAALLAAHGYPTLALAYWKAPGLPRTSAGSRWSTSGRRSPCCAPNPVSIPPMSWSPARPGAEKAACSWPRPTLTWCTASSRRHPTRMWTPPRSAGTGPPGH
jgi:Acyl-CoA thioester hydrolase/BAAT N-terminal region